PSYLSSNLGSEYGQAPQPLDSIGWLPRAFAPIDDNQGVANQPRRDRRATPHGFPHGRLHLAKPSYRVAGVLCRPIFYAPPEHCRGSTPLPALGRALIS